MEKNCNSYHPWWYYKYFNLVFGRGGGYVSDVHALCRGGVLVGKIIEEVGSGLGGHGDEILKQRVEKLRLVENDVYAYNFLCNKYSKSMKVEVVYADGFAESPVIVDYIVAYYSIVQQCTSFEVLAERIARLIARVDHKGALCFEFIDADNSIKLYGNTTETRLVDSEDVSISVSTRYTEKSFAITYTGFIESFPVSYTAVLLRLNSRDVETLADNFGCECMLVALDESNRRKFAIFKRTNVDIDPDLLTGTHGI